MKTPSVSLLLGVSVLLLSGLTVSAGELMEVKTVSDTSPPPSSPSNVYEFILFCHLVVFCPYCISTVLLVSICCSRKTGNKAAVAMETTQPAGGGQRLDEECDDIIADVTTEHEF